MHLTTLMSVDVDPNAQWPDPTINMSEGYEERVVSFSDILGWRAHIQQTLVDPERLKWLRATVESWSFHSKKDYSIGYGGLRITSFSDNVVFSQDADEAGTLIARLALMQLMGAGAGFWIRGGVTLGKIIHKPTCVFGPALNRAYELESKTAIVPRIVVDEMLIGNLGSFASLVVFEEGVHFIDPFTPDFFERVRNGEIQSQRPFGSERSANTISAYLRAEMKKGLVEKEAKKILWLYLRLARNFKSSPFAKCFPLP